MRKIRIKKNIALFLLSFTCLYGFSQETFYQGRITDKDNNTYTLTKLTIAGQTIFRCRIRETVFTIPFSQVQSLSFPNQPVESPYKGYVTADFVLTNGERSRVFLNIENYWLEGIEINFQIRLKIPLNEIVNLNITQPQPNIRPTQE